MIVPPEFRIVLTEPTAEEVLGLTPADKATSKAFGHDDFVVVKHQIIPDRIMVVSKSDFNEWRKRVFEVTAARAAGGDRLEVQMSHHKWYTAVKRTLAIAYVRNVFNVWTDLMGEVKWDQYNFSYANLDISQLMTLQHWYNRHLMEYV